MLIRIDTSIQMILNEDTDIWRHYNIQKQLIRLNNQSFDFNYLTPEIPENPQKNNWEVFAISIGIGAIVITGVVLGIRSKKNNKITADSDSMMEENKP